MSPARTTAVHQRVDGLARIRFEQAADGRTTLRELYQRAPCRLLFPNTEPGEPFQAVLLTTSGGLTGGDRTRVEIEVDAQTRATVTTQAAEKLYRALADSDDTRIEVDVRVGEGAWAEWLAQETIFFEAAKLRRSLVADVAPTGRLLAVESLVLGRTAMGERVCNGRLHDEWRVRRDSRLIWADALHMDGDIHELLRAPFGFGTAVACSTVLYVAPDAGALTGDLRRLIAQYELPATATALDGVLVIRMLAENGARLREAVMQVSAAIRSRACGLPARMPRVWYC